MTVPKFLLRGFRRPREVVAPALGALEREVLECLWRRGEASVRDVHAAFGETNAYTTLMTTLDRLYRKGLLTRRKEGRAFRYAPRFTREEFERGIREDLLEGLLGQNAEGVEPMLSYIVERVGERDRALLDRLDQLVKEKRKELKRKS
jgi:BlaI family transcriptional regulator, penicillinase repressor